MESAELASVRPSGQAKAFNVVWPYGLMASGGSGQEGRRKALPQMQLSRFSEERKRRGARTAQEVSWQKSALDRPRIFKSGGVRFRYRLYHFSHYVVRFIQALHVARRDF